MLMTPSRSADGGRRIVDLDRCLTEHPHTRRRVCERLEQRRDRAALDAQVQQQIAEITRIASQTSFNGTKVLDGSSGVTTFQVGANVGNTISVNLAQGVRADQIGQVASGGGTNVTATALTGSNLTIQVGTGTAVSIGASVAGSAGTTAGQSSYSAYSKVQAINAAGVAGLTASASTTATGAAAFSNITGGSAGTTTH